MKFLDIEGVKALMANINKKAYAPMSLAYMDEKGGEDALNVDVVFRIPRNVIDEDNLTNYEIRFYRYYKRQRIKYNGTQEDKRNVARVYVKNRWSKACATSSNKSQLTLDINNSDYVNGTPLRSYFYIHIPFLQPDSSKDSLAKLFSTNYTKKRDKDGATIIKWGCKGKVLRENGATGYVVMGAALYNKTNNTRITNIVPFKIGLIVKSVIQENYNNVVILPSHTETIAE